MGVDVNHIYCVSCRQNGSAHVVLCRPSKDKQHFACLPFVVVVFFYVRARDPCFLSQCAHRSRGTPQVTSTASFEGRKGRAVAFATSSFKKGSSAEHLSGTCMRSRLKKNNTSGFGVLRFQEWICVPTVSSSSRDQSSQVPPTCLTMVAPGGWYPS